MPTPSRLLLICVFACFVVGALPILFAALSLDRPAINSLAWACAAAAVWVARLLWAAS